MDYAYTLQGWLKGVNSTSVNDGTYDMGADGKIGGTNVLVARDAYGFSLNYYSTIVNGVTVNDYKSINTAVTPFVTINNETTLTGKQLFNGNISSMVVNMPKLGDAKIYQYGYDQLNRLIAVDAYNGLNNSNNTFAPAAINDYKERLTYSANGNIQTYQRNGNGATVNLNNYSYNYQSGTNRLTSVYNSVNTSTGAYTYDAIGNVTSDGKQNVTQNQWNVYGKLKQVQKSDATIIQYTYDAGGQRISKKIGSVEEWYVRDAAGNIMATYTKESSINSGHLTATEFYKYGSSMLGIMKRNVDMEAAPDNSGITIFERGRTEYQLSNHLGNNMVIVSDRKLQVDANSDGQVDYYTADVISATDYSAYGAISRSYNENKMQYAFNGQKRSTEISSTAQTALFWEYNGDVGRRWNIDPKPNIAISPYNCFEGNPIWLSDRLGDTARVKWAGNNISYVEGKWIDTKTRKEFDVNSIRKKNIKRVVDAYTTLNGIKEFSEVTTMINENKSNVYLKWGAGETDGVQFVDQKASGILNPDIPVFASKTDSPSDQNYSQKKVKLPDYVVLGHELGHVWDMLRGEKKEHFIGKIENEGYKNEKNYPAFSEINAMYWENVLRAHSGITLRMNYGRDKYGGITMFSKVLPSENGKTATISTFNDERSSIVPFK